MFDTSTLQAGDALWRMKGIVKHWGIYLRGDYVLEITPNSVPQIVSFEEFSGDKEVHIERSRDADRPVILERANRVLRNPARYHWLSNNCQHLKNFVLTGQHYSEDVRTLVMLTSMTLLLAIANRA